MTYSVKEIFYTLQGEGAQTGRPAVFCRFAGCNLWSGRENDRKDAICQFCDTDFVGTDGLGGGKFKDAESLARVVKSKWPEKEMAKAYPYVVCTGGEPLLQLDELLVNAFQQEGFEVAVETNGTCDAPEGIDWICVSPKSSSETILHCGNELKLVFPQDGARPGHFEDFEFDHFYLQPMDGPDVAANTQKVIEYCKSNPMWRLGIQMHKVVNMP